MRHGIRVLVAGATGLVGRELVRRLIDDPGVEEVRALVRREVRLPTGVRPVRVDFDNLDADPALFDVDHVYCALGTTIKVAGSRSAFRRIDQDLPLEIASRAREAGARHFLLVSALGARADSSVFYNRVKGELEDAVLALGYPSVTIARPSLLLGSREQERAGESVAKWFMPHVPRKWRAVQAGSVAEALVQAGALDQPGNTILENPSLLAQYTP